jgi:hypothetical protein
MMGSNNTQIMISATAGRVPTQFQSEVSHSGFTTCAMANPTHSIAKITMAYVLSNRGTATSQNHEFLIVILLDLCRRSQEQEDVGYGNHAKFKVS